MRNYDIIRFHFDSEAMTHINDDISYVSWLVGEVTRKRVLGVRRVQNNQ